MKKSRRSKRRRKDKTNFLNVSVRIRPPIRRELEKDFQNCVKLDENTVYISEDFADRQEDDPIYQVHSYTFDQVFPPKASQENVYQSTGKIAVGQVFEGYNATVMAYGPTGSGKTYTMFQDPSIAKLNRNEELLGIIPRAGEDIFNVIQENSREHMKYLVRASYLQIYNEMITDLLNTTQQNLDIREIKGKKGVYVEGLSEWVVRSPREIFNLMNFGNKNRITSETLINEKSSRSHAVFIIILEQCEKVFFNRSSGERLFGESLKAAQEQKVDVDVEEHFKVGKLNLVDLAGSENVRISKSRGVHFNETCNINQSLLTLGNVIRSLIQQSQQSSKKSSRRSIYIPYRDSKLTRMLKDSLGGNCKTFLIGTSSPALFSYKETLKTLYFVQQAKLIKNKAYVNKDMDQKTLIRQYERELKKLRIQLEKSKQRNSFIQNQQEQQHNMPRPTATTTNFRKGHSPGGYEKVSILEAQKRQAEEDKHAIICLLEQRSREYLHEKQQKRKLQEKIAQLESKFITMGEDHEFSSNGSSSHNNSFKQVLQEERDRVQKEYQEKLVELEKELKSIEQDKEQVNRYKQLLIKQRDIMVALTTRLNERDETILEMEEEIDAYDKHFVNLENAFDEQKKTILEVEKMLLNQLPIKYSEKIKSLFSIPKNLFHTNNKKQNRRDDDNDDDDDDDNDNNNNNNIRNVNISNFLDQQQQQQQSSNRRKKEEEEETKTNPVMISNFLNEKDLEDDDDDDIESEGKEVIIEKQRTENIKLSKEKRTLENENKQLKLKIQLLGSSLKKIVSKDSKKMSGLSEIWENKVKMLVDSIYQNVGKFYKDQTSLENVDKEKIVQTKHLIVSLHKLVNESLVCLKNSNHHHHHHHGVTEKKKKKKKRKRRSSSSNSNGNGNSSLISNWN